MKPVPRLMEDEQFRKETGLDLANERLDLMDHPLDLLKARMVGRAAAVDAGVAVARVVSYAPHVVSLAAGGAVCFALGFMAHAVMVSKPPTVVDPTPPVLPPAITQPKPIPIPDAVATSSSSVGVATSEPAPPRRDASLRSARPPASTAVAPKVEPPPAEVTPPTSYPHRVTLAEQMRMFENGRTALLAHNHEVAARELGAYVTQVPDGDLWPEANLLLLDARMGKEQWHEADRHASELLTHPRMRADRTRVLLRRAEIRARLGRCTEAHADLDELTAPAPSDATRQTRRVVDGLCP